MSVSGIGTTSLFSYLTQNVQSSRQQFQQQFQQLGQDLESGNLSAAQSDFVTLQQDMPGRSSSSAESSSSSSQSSSPIAQAFSQLASDLRSGNLSGAQSDYSTIQQDFQSMAAQHQSAHGHHHYHHDDNSQSGEISQLFQPLGSALQSGNLSSAQQLYSSLQQDLTGSTSSSSTTTSAASAKHGRVRNCVSREFTSTTTVGDSLSG
jgi:hypothetical protein